MEEIWKNIEGYEGKYKISNLGRVLMLGSYSDGRRYKESIKKTRFDKGGYEYTILTNWKGKSKTIKIHRLVAEAFIPNNENKPCIDHIDCNRANNNVENLRWATYKENANNPITRKHLSDALKEVCNSEESRAKKRMYAIIPQNIEARRSKVIRNVMQFDKNGTLVNEFKSITDAAKSVNGNVTSITRNCRGRRPSAYGYVWRYKEDSK